MFKTGARGRLKEGAVVLMLAVMGAACGDDDGEDTASTVATTAPSSTGTTSTGTTAATGGATTTRAAATTAGSATTSATTAQAGGGGAPSGEPIKIGFAVALSGVQSGTTDSALAVAEAWAEYANAQGGVAGRPVEIVSADTKSDPAAGQAVVKDLVDEGAVAMIVLDNIAEAAAVPALQQAGVPLLGIGYSTEVFSKLPNVYGNTTTIPAVVTSQVLASRALGLGTFAAMSCAEAPSCAQADLIYRPTSEALGLRYGGLLTIAASAPNYTAECLALIQDGMEYIQLSTPASTSIRAAGDCKRQGYEGTFGVSAGTAAQREMEKVDGAVFAGNFHGFPWFADAPPAQAFRDAMEQYSPDTDYRDPTSTASWSALELFRKAMADVQGEVTAETVSAEYGKISDETLDGLLPQPFTFTAGQPSPKIDCFWLYKYTVGDENPELLPVQGESGNGAQGDLASSCLRAG